MIIHPEAARIYEPNLLRNPDFTTRLRLRFYQGPMEYDEAEMARLSGGRMFENIDVDNLIHTNPENALSYGRRFQCTVTARGRGVIQFGIRAVISEEHYAVDHADRTSPEYPLNDEWQTFTFEGLETAKSCLYHDRFFVEVPTGSFAEIKHVGFCYRRINDPAWRFKPSHAIATPGEPVRFTLHTGLPFRHLQCLHYAGHQRMARPCESSEITTDANGDFSYEFQMRGGCIDGERVSFIDPQTGVKHSFFASLLPPAQVKRMRSFASAASSPQTLLFLGDSLTDYDRGRNYVDILAGLLPHDWILKNAGIGGDDTERLLKRLRSEPVQRSNMYDGLFDESPDRVFIFLGGNDTKAPSATGYRVAVTPPEKQEKLLREIIQIIRSRTQAQITLIAAASSYSPYQEEKAAAMRRDGTSHNQFGIDEHIRAFNQINQKLASELGLDYLDVYNATANHPDKRQLFIPDDGVHLSLTGHACIAEQILASICE